MRGVHRTEFSLNLALAAAVGGALGAVVRHLVVQQTANIFGTDLPWGTFIVNTIGSFILGIAVEIFALIWTPGQAFQIMLTAGLCGSLTTFSAFSMDLVTLFEQGFLTKAGIYLVVSILSGVMALLAGMALIRAINT
tara:strand:+ start:559 stop:969 length:411 start_codon:yes stop_codon:yes gene_type:complete